MDEKKVYPVLTPLLALLKSRKFWVGVGGLLADLVIANVPEAEPYRAELVIAVTAVAAVLIGAIAHEDAAKG